MTTLFKANATFSKFVEPDVFQWTATILAHARLGQGKQAIELYHQMHFSNVIPDAHTYVATLKACSSAAALDQGKVVHVGVKCQGLNTNITIGNALIHMYFKCSNLENANNVFVDMQERDVVTWNTTIAGYAHNNCGFKAFDCFKQMQLEGVILDHITYISILKTCSLLGAVNQGKHIHCIITMTCFGSEMQVKIGNALMDMYSDFGTIEQTCKVFEGMRVRDIVTWSTIIRAHGKLGHGFKALQLFGQAQEEGIIPDQIMLIGILEACSSIAAMDYGREIHGYTIEIGCETDIYVGSALIDLYSKCECFADADRLFGKLPKVNVVTWSSMIAAYAMHGQEQEALSLLAKMQHEGVEPNQITFVNILKTCFNSMDLTQGKVLHNQILKRGFENDLLVGSTLIHMYTTCGGLLDAQCVFDLLENRNVVTWNALLAGYAHHSCTGKTLHLFLQMQEEGVEPNGPTFVTLLKSCSSLGSLEKGRLIHGLIVERMLDCDEPVGSILVIFYVLCGSPNDASKVFQVLPKENVVLWNAMIAACTQHRDFKLVGEYFCQMKHKGSTPNDATFVGLLSACKELDAGVSLFKAMTQDHCITPKFNHYECLLNLLSSAGHLDDAEYLFSSIPLQIDCVGLVSLLSRCKTYGNMEIGRRCFDYLIAKNSSN